MMYFNHHLRPPNASTTAARPTQIHNEIEDLLEGPATFTSDRVRSVLRECVEAYSKISPTENWYSDTFHCDHFIWGPGEDPEHFELDSPTRQERIKTFCSQLVSRAHDPGSHLTKLDELLSSLVLCRFQTEDKDVVVGRACQILSRLPRVPPPVKFDNYAIVWNPEELAQYTSNQSTDVRPEWDGLKVVAAVSSTTIKLSLQIAAWNKHPNTGLARSMQHYVNFVAELLDAVNSQALTQRSSRETYIVLAFLWTTWQRAVMLFFYFVMAVTLGGDAPREFHQMLALRGTDILSHPSVRATLHGWNAKNDSYMCRWAFQLLLKSRASLSIDFRKFHQVFSAAHGNKRARCLYDSDRSCDGSRPQDCGRFRDRRLVAEEQSMHDPPCSGKCGMLTWDEASYRSIAGPRSVILDAKARKIQYCTTSPKTLAISHVWSHGQGGRPHEGVNKCLHRRYVKIAKDAGCDSYWFDTVCIPEDHNLRSEAIQHINRIFSGSKITLVCDRDLMSVDIRAGLTLPIVETLLVTLLVCDWNVRAWTFLESMFGTRSLYLLCARNQIVALHELLEYAHSAGRIDIIILFLSMQQYLAPRVGTTRRTIEETGNLLSHRYATRPGDDIVIWSLLSSTKLAGSAEEMWRNKIKARVNTGYLMSTAPRLEGVRGFSWAPKNPGVYADLPKDSNASYFAFDGAGSVQGKITPRGLQADWLAYPVDESESQLYAQPPAMMLTSQSDGTVSNVPLLGHKKINDCWGKAVGLLKSYEGVYLLQPMSATTSGPYLGTQGRGVLQSGGTPIAICASKDMECWEWKGVYEWPMGLKLPEFEPEFEILLV